MIALFVVPTAVLAAAMLVGVYLTTKSPALRRTKLVVCFWVFCAVISLFSYVGSRPPPQTCFVTLVLSHLFFAAVHNLTLSRSMVLNEIFGNTFRRVNATTRIILVRALALSAPDVLLTVSWFLWGIANGSISVHRSGFGCGHPNGQYLTTLAVAYRCACVLVMLYNWKQLRNYKHLVAEQTCATLKLLAVAYYLTVSGLAVTALAPVDMARYSAYVIVFSATLGLSLISMFGANLAVAIWPVDSGEVVEVPSDILIVTGTSTARATSEAVRGALKICCDQIAGRLPNLIVVSYTEQHDPKLVRSAIQRLFPQTPITGASTCIGVLNSSTFSSKGGFSLGIWMVCDPEGVYAVAHCAYQSAGGSSQVMPKHMSTAANIAGQQCINQALVASASRKGPVNRSETCSGSGDPEQLPPFVWMSAHPGHEEELIAGMKLAFGHSDAGELPIVGGTAADNAVKKHWSVLSSAPKAGDGSEEVAIALCWPSVHVKIAMFSAYAPQARSGEVTKSAGRRIIEIDGKPAAQVLNKWSGNSYDEAVKRSESKKPTNILSLAAMFPLGRQLGYDFEEEPWYQNIHPNDVGPDGSVGCFAVVREGDVLYQMSTTKEALLRKVGTAAKHIVRDSHFSLSEIKGSLAVYCGGCMLAVKDDMNSACDTLAAALGHAPYMGICSFGEQGPGPEGQALHANLMFATAVFSNKRRIARFSNSGAVTNSGPTAHGSATYTTDRRHSGPVHVNVSPYSALAPFQGPVSPRRGSWTRHSGMRKTYKVQPRAVTTHAPSSDTQFGDSVLYGMEEDIPVSPLSHSSSLGQPSSLDSSGHGGSNRVVPTDTKNVEPWQRPSRNISRVGIAPNDSDSQRQLQQAQQAAAAAERREAAAGNSQTLKRYGSRGQSLRRIASMSNLTPTHSNSNAEV